jgi:hypothetical protein
VPQRARPRDREDHAETDEDARVAAPAPPDRAGELLAMQQGAGNAAVSRMLSTGGAATVARWKYLGEEAWTIPSFTRRKMKVWTATKDEWKRQLADMDDEDEYKENIWGFLTVSNEPSIVGRRKPPPHISDDAAGVAYENTIDRVPTQAEKLTFLEALFESGDDLDLWHGGSFEGGPYSRYADMELAKFIASNQDLYLVAMAQQGRPISSGGAQAVATQGGKQATMAMITNAGATAHKGVDLLVTATRKQEGQEKQSAHAVAYELIRNSGRTIAAALKAHDARVQFEQGITAAVFDHVWEDSEPGDQAEKIRDEFVVTCNKLVHSGEVKSPEVQDAINGFEAVRQG